MQGSNYNLQIVIHGSTLSFFLDHFKEFFVKSFQNFPSVRIIVLRETAKFLFTLQPQQFAYKLLQKMLN